MAIPSDVIASMPSGQDTAQSKDDHKDQVTGSIRQSQRDWDVLRGYKYHRMKSIKSFTNDDCSRELALIQVHSILVAVFSIIVLVELKHVSSVDSHLFHQYCELFQSSFPASNSIYGWGPSICRTGEGSTSSSFFYLFSLSVSAN